VHWYFDRSYHSGPLMMGRCVSHGDTHTTVVVVGGGWLGGWVGGTTMTELISRHRPKVSPCRTAEQKSGFWEVAAYFILPKLLHC